MSRASSMEDLGHWAIWWDLNKAPYLNLREQIWTGGPLSGGGGDLFLGTGQVDQIERSLRPTRDMIQRDIVPLLEAALATETSNDIVTGALIALARIGDRRDERGRSRFAALMRPFLADSNQEISETAALALGILGQDESAPLLAALLRNEPMAIEAVGSSEVSFRTRAFAAYGLTLLSRRTSNPDVSVYVARALADGLGDARDDVQAACVIGLGLCPLPELFTTQPEQGVVAPLATRADQRALLVGLMQDEGRHPIVRAQAPVALARLFPSDEAQASELVELWIDALDSRNRYPNELCRGAAQALGLVIDADGDSLDRAARAALLDVPNSLRDAQSRSFALIALAHIGARPGGGDEPGIGSDEIERHLMRSLVSGEQRQRPWAALASGVFTYALIREGSPQPSALTSAMRGELAGAKNPELVGALCIGLGLMQDQNSVELLQEAFDEVSDAETRGFAAVALGLLQARGSIERITKVVERSEYRPELLKRCAIALGLMGDKQVADALTSMLSESTSLASQAALAEGLGFIGDHRAVRPLGDMLSDPSLTALARGFAAASLGLVGARDELPWKTPITTELNYRAAPETLNDSQGKGIANLL